MKQLFIIRHGKSSWDHLVDDIDRPLAERGIRGAHLVAERLEGAGLVPDQVISSPAARALHTAEIITRALNIGSSRLAILDELYLAELHDILKLIARTDPGLASLAVIGHNPGLTDLCNWFLERGIDNLPTAGVLVLTFDSASWDKLDRKKVVDYYFDYPKREQ